jgi:hypothetical protein
LLLECWELVIGSARNEQYKLYQGRTREGGGSEGVQAPPQKNRSLKNTDFVDIMIANVLCDLPFSRNQPLKSTDNQNIRILKNKLIKIKKKNTGRR